MQILEQCIWRTDACRRTPESVFTKFGEEMSIGQTLILGSGDAMRRHASVRH